jgi:hypothetical protein
MNEGGDWLQRFEKRISDVDGVNIKISPHVPIRSHPHLACIESQSTG